MAPREEPGLPGEDELLAVVRVIRTSTVAARYVVRRHVLHRRAELRQRVRLRSLRLRRLLCRLQLIGAGVENPLKFRNAYYTRTTDFILYPNHGRLYTARGLYQTVPVWEGPLGWARCCALVPSRAAAAAQILRPTSHFRRWPDFYLEIFFFELAKKFQTNPTTPYHPLPPQSVITDRHNGT